MYGRTGITRTRYRSSAATTRRVRSSLWKNYKITTVLRPPSSSRRDRQQPSSLRASTAVVPQTQAQRCSDSRTIASSVGAGGPWWDGSGIMEGRGAPEAPPTRLRQRMISDERTWMQGGMPPTYGSPGRVGISQQQGGTGTLPSLSDRRTPDLEVLDRKVRQAAQHPSSSGRRSVGQQAGRRLSDRRGAAAPAALAIPPPPTYASRAHTAAEAGTGQLAGAAQLPERPYTTSVLHVAPQGGPRRMPSRTEIRVVVTRQHGGFYFSLGGVVFFRPRDKTGTSEPFAASLRRPFNGLSCLGGCCLSCQNAGKC